jgi:biotin carboxylase
MSGRGETAAPSGVTAPLLLWVGSGDRRYREYIAEAAAAHYRLWLLDAEEPTWQKPYLDGWAVIDTGDPGAIAAAGRAAGVSAGPVSGLLCYDEWTVHAAALAARALGLPASPPDAVAACRDKATTRRVLAAAGIPQPRSAAVASAGQARAAAEAIGFPVVVKARSLAGSLGVVQAGSPEAVTAAFAAAAGASMPSAARHDAPVLVEEYLDGPEISIDSAVSGGRCHPLVLARKQVGLHPYFEETGHTVDGADPLRDDPGLAAAVRAVHRALGFSTGVTHAEFRLTAAGPRLVEINARLGGDFIPYLGYLATGVDPVRAAADIAAGRCPRPRPTRCRAAGIRFLYPAADCRVRHVRIRQERMTAAVHRVRITALPGQELRLPPRGYLSRYGYLIAAADTAAGLRPVLGEPESLVELHAGPI